MLQFDAFSCEEKGKKCGRGRIGEEDGYLRRSGRVGSGRVGKARMVLFWCPNPLDLELR